jgi:hypothetical protein
MKVLTCAAARRRLQAYHDGELPISDQIDVDAHLEWCDPCAAALTDIRTVRAVLRAVLPGREAMAVSDDANLQGAVISRIRAEKTRAWSTRIRTMFDDMHMVYAGLGACVATTACITILLGMMRFAADNRSPGSNQNPVVVDARMLMPRPLDEVLMTVGTKDEAMYTLSGVVTREGRIVNLALHAENDEPLADDDVNREALQDLLGSVSRARFEPARVAGFPVAVNMVWMVARTTVRAAQTPLPLVEPTTTSVKKRRVEVAVPARTRSTRIA